MIDNPDVFSADEMEEWLEQQDDVQADEIAQEPAAEAVTDVHAAEITETADSNTTESATVDSDNGAAEPVLLAKDGKSEIPFKVLEETRARNSSLEQENEELRAKTAESERNARIIELNNKQFEGLGVEPKRLPEDAKVSESQLDTLSEDYPEIAEPVIAIHAESKRNAEKAQQLQIQLDRLMQERDARASEEVNAVVQTIPELREIQQTGGADWDRAVQVDHTLLNDPEWRTQPTYQRLKEVTRRMDLTSESDAKARAAAAATKAVETASNQLPTSPSEVGHTNTHSQSDKEFLKTASSDELFRKMGGLSDAEIESLLTLDLM